MELFQFAFCPSYDEKIQSLSQLCPEKWSYGSSSDNVILKNYIKHTFSKIYDEKKICEKDDFAIFNTGLFSQYYEPIYAYFIINSIPDRQKWRFDSFYTSYQISLQGITEKPPRADYFSNPGELVFDTNCDIIPQYSHIFNDPENFLRIPETIRNSPNKILLFDGAIKRAKNMIDANYKTAVPQYYNAKIQLLVPICLTNENVPDLALVLSKSENGNQYIGHTCLTLDMAYNNARLIARPDSVWLKP